MASPTTFLPRRGSFRHLGVSVCARHQIPRDLRDEPAVTPNAATTLAGRSPAPRQFRQRQCQLRRDELRDLLSIGAECGERSRGATELEYERIATKSSQRRDLPSNGTEPACGFEAERYGDCLLQQRSPRHHRRAVRLGKLRERISGSSEVPPSTSMLSRICSTSAVSIASRLVAPQCMAGCNVDASDQQLNQRDRERPACTGALERWHVEQLAAARFGDGGAASPGINRARLRLRERRLEAEM